MKRCPECGREFDLTMSFCLDDGSELLYGPASMDEPQTAILSEPGAIATGFRTDEEKTRAFKHTTQTEAEPRESLGGPSEKRSSSANRAAKPLIAAATVSVLLIAAFLGYRYFSSAESGSINSIAVLPFENRSGIPDTDYLSDGLTDSLIFRFSQLPNLRVSPTSSVVRYKGTSKGVAEIARELDVDGVLSGRLMQVGDNLVISVQLIDTRSNKIVWAEQYDRKMSDLLATQREIAVTLTQKMQLKLAGDERGIAKKYTSSNEAYQLYMKGRYHWSKRTKQDLDKSVESFKSAIALDPNFALAYVGMAEAYNSMAKIPEAAPKDAVPFAKSAAMRALELDSTLAEAHSSLADALAIYDWNWSESEREFQKAIELDPNVGYIHAAYSGSFLSAANRQDESIREAERAVEIEPLSLINNSILASAYFLGRKYDKAMIQAQKTVDLDPAFPLGKFWLGVAYIANGRYDEALEITRDVPESAMGGNMMFVTALAHARAGRRAEVEQTISRIRELGNTRYVRPYFLTWAYAALGDKDKAFAELERSFVQRDTFLGRMRVDPLLDPLRDDPRFKDLLRRMNLPE